jgi:iron complex transport system ATP-binding protein
MAALGIRHVSFSYSDGLVLDDVDLSVASGEMVGLLGPNGSGKTTLVKLASGVLKPLKGEIRLDDADLKSLGRKTVARSVAVMPQYFHIPFAFTVGEVIALGRLPFIRTIAGETAADREAVSSAMVVVGIEDLAERRFDELSGGERQKVVLAMALAQQPRLLLLDEPTAHLDISHQVEILEQVRRLNRDHGVTIIAAIHDLNLASLYFDRLVLLKEGRVIADGPPDEVITEEIVRRVFAAPVTVDRHPLTGAPHVVVTPGEDSVLRQVRR